MTKDYMYVERIANIAAYRGCAFNCSYCAFRNTLKRSKCENCREFKPHAHLECLDRVPPKTKDKEFITIGLNGDISFATENEFISIIRYCIDWYDRTFVLQTKNPAIFLGYQHYIPNNVIVSTTIETNRDKLIKGISFAPPPSSRYKAMVQLKDVRKSITIEPIMDFDLDILVQWMRDIKSESIYIGFDNHNKNLNEPSIEKTMELIKRLSGFTDVRKKNLKR